MAAAQFSAMREFGSVRKFFTATPTGPLAITKGQSVTVLGSNGSEKSTLLRLLARVYDPPGGRILLDGVDIS